ncbi:S1C family serine protease [Rhodopirellula sallentina]|uniref:Protease degQ n=1 Tax=Rhodopirellula sallentina SM41 TaxID=1263870 RepID=M5TW89_9BACT|nr:PDZ domain-containing protein [Rhodopirellula sallentina]EMI53299.1 protease degQ [Rhodopirellula sallentina SM41]
MNAYLRTLLVTLFSLVSLSAVSAEEASPTTIDADASTPIVSKESGGILDESTQASLGVMVASLPEVLASHLPEALPNGRGILVSNVVEGSAADAAGLQRNDILVRYDDQDLYSSEQLIKRVRNDKPGDEVALEYIRGGKLQSTKVVLDKTLKPRRTPVNEWSGMTPPFNFPWSSMLPSFSTNQNIAGNDNTEWNEFVSLSVVKEADGTYTARITFNDENGESVSHEFKGKRQEVRDAINADTSLPEHRKNQLLRTLDDRANDFRDSLLNGLRRNHWQSRPFNWQSFQF